MRVAKLGLSSRPGLTATAAGRRAREMSLRLHQMLPVATRPSEARPLTHMVPDDDIAMLRLLRRFVKPDGRLFYTLFINEKTDGGHGYVDHLSRAMAKANDRRMKEMIGARMAKREPPDFVDAWAGKGMM